MARINFVNILLGRRGTGKSYFVTQQLLPAYQKQHPDKRVLIVDTLDHPMYQGVPAVTTKMLGRWKHPGGVCRIYEEDGAAILAEINTSMRNAIIIFEDATKYIERRLSNETKRFVIDSKQKNLDLIFLFHGFSYCPPELFRIADNLVLFKCDNPDYRKKEIVGYEEVATAWKEVMRSTNPYSNKTVRLQ